MTDLEVMQRAKMYIDKMANGISPFDDSPIKDDSVLNDVRMARCLFYVSGVLDRVIQNGGEVAKKRTPRRNRIPFSITDDQLAKVEVSTEPVQISQLVNNINAVCVTEDMKKLASTRITNWLVEKGILEIREIGGANYKIPTEAGALIGIKRVGRSGQYGDYYVNIYNEEAQRFLLDNMHEILIYNEK